MPHNAEASINIFNLENWKRIGTFVVLNIGIGILVTVVVILVMYLTSSVSRLLSGVLSLGVVLMGMALLLSEYESWRGCRITDDY